MTIISKMLLGFLLVTLFPIHANDGGSGLTTWYNQLYGTEGVRQQISNCEAIADSVDTGLLGFSNRLFCRLEKEIGITGATTGVTGSYDFYSGKIFVRVIVDGSVGGASFNGYDYEAQVWGCRLNAGVTECDQTSQFDKFAYILWTSDAAKTVNKGIIVQDQYINNGSSGYYVKTEWDSGSASATKFSTTKSWDGRYSGYSKLIETATTRTVRINQTLQTIGMRWAASFDLTTNRVRTALDVQNSFTATKNDAVSFNNCYDRYIDGDDFSATPNNDAGACSGAPAVNQLDDDLITMSNYNDATIIDPSEGFANMATHPAAL